MADVPLVVYSVILVTVFVIVNAGLGGEVQYQHDERTKTGAADASFRRVDLKQEQIIAYLKENGGHLTKLQNPSTEFIMQIFRNLLRGQQLTEAAGHTDGRTRGRVLSSDTIRSFTASDAGAPGRIHFRIPQLPTHEHVRMAELRIGGYRLGRRQTFTMVTRINEQIVKTVKFTRKPRLENTFDLTRVLFSQLNNHHGNLTIEIKDESSKQRTVWQGHATDKESILSKTILVLYSQDKHFLNTVYSSFSTRDVIAVNTGQNKTTVSRQKRASNSDTTRKRKRRRRKKNRWNNKNNSEICKLHDFKVNFDLIGWGPWIIHPKTFNAHVCWGQCPSPIGHEFSPTNHAMLQSLMRMKRPLSAPEPCCVPTKLTPLSMLYFEYDDIVVRHHEGMVAAECGCR